MENSEENTDVDIGASRVTNFKYLLLPVSSSLMKSLLCLFTA